MSSIAFIIPYFGVLPEWNALFFETLNRNSSIDFHIFTDIEIDIGLPDNVIIHRITFNEYVQLVNQFLDFDFRPPNAYKLCDARPLFGLIHQNLLKEYDFYGWTDMDILYGDIRGFYTDEILSKYDVLSTHAHTISGHMALFRNNKKNREMYKRIYDWKAALQNPKFVGIDEHGITNAYLYTFWDKLKFKFGFQIHPKINVALKSLRKKRMYLVEQYTTPFTPLTWLDGSINSDQPDSWFYKDGKITNSRDGEREFIYLHFMNFKSAIWRHDGTPAPWEGLENYINVDPEDMQRGIKIDLSGISKL